MQDQSRKDSVKLRKRWPPPTEKMLARHQKTVTSSYYKLKGARPRFIQNYQSQPSGRKFRTDADGISVT